MGLSSDNAIRDREGFAGSHGAHSDLAGCPAGSSRWQDKGCGYQEGTAQFPCNMPQI
jgi:hypothetical protein